MTADPRTLRNFIGGQWVESLGSERLSIPNPALGTALGKVPLSRPADVDRAVVAARTAFPGWRETPVAERMRVIARFLARLQAAENELARGVTEEHGKILSDALGSVRRGIEATEFALSAPTLMQGSFLANVSPGVDSEMTREPVGVVVGITPFNFPVMVPLW
ncbi:MAG: aldehyde dehydrogenase family protein, partial [Thermoplasmata archaeon]|nr:aldehyde dehydrogenase family protein [Thermoplasmata archaeon]